MPWSWIVWLKPVPCERMINCALIALAESGLNTIVNGWAVLIVVFV